MEAEGLSERVWASSLSAVEHNKVFTKGEEEDGGVRNVWVVGQSTAGEENAAFVFAFDRSALRAELSAFS